MTIIQCIELTVDVLDGPGTLTSDFTSPCQSNEAADILRRLAEYALVMEPGVQVRLRCGVTHNWEEPAPLVCVSSIVIVYSKVRIWDVASRARTRVRETSIKNTSIQCQRVIYRAARCTSTGAQPRRVHTAKSHTCEYSILFL